MPNLAKRIKYPEMRDGITINSGSYKITGATMTGSEGGTVTILLTENPGEHRKHTPIVSKAQQGMMGAEYARRKAGKKGRMKGMTTKELKSHLEESKGKKLPKRSKGKK